MKKRVPGSERQLLLKKTKKRLVAQRKRNQVDYVKKEAAQQKHTS